MLRYLFDEIFRSALGATWEANKLNYHSWHSLSGSPRRDKGRGKPLPSGISRIFNLKGIEEKGERADLNGLRPQGPPDFGFFVTLIWACCNINLGLL